MKICFLGDIRSAHVQKFIKWFAWDHRTYLISLDYPEDPRVKTGKEFFDSIGTEVYLLPNSLTLLPITTAATLRIIREISPDILQCHFVTNYGFLGAFSGFHPLVISAMGDDILIHPKEFLKGSLVKYALPRADTVFYDGQNSMTALKDLGVPEEKRALVYPGVNMEKFNPNKRVPLPYKMVFYPRGFDKIYDVDMVLSVIKTVHFLLPETRFVMMGTGTELETFKKNVETARNGKTLAKRIEYLGNLNNNEVPRYLASADVSFSCSMSDGGIPTSTIESMACGVPVVSTDVGDASLWLENGKTGFTVERGNGAAMAYFIAYLLICEERRREMGKAAREKVEAAWNYSSEMKKIEGLYSKLINISKS